MLYLYTEKIAEIKLLHSLCTATCCVIISSKFYFMVQSHFLINKKNIEKLFIVTRLSNSLRILTTVIEIFNDIQFI